VCSCLNVRKGEEVVGQGHCQSEREWGCSVAAPPDGLDSSPALGPLSLATPPTSGSIGYSTSRATPARPGENGSASSGLSTPAWRAGSWPLEIAPPCRPMIIFRKWRGLFFSFFFFKKKKKKNLCMPRGLFVALNLFKEILKRS